MAKGKAFLIVGHADWGKSSTLKALTNGKKPWFWEMDSITFFIKRMSNDDVPLDVKKLAEKLDPKIHPHVILALCPTFNDAKRLPVLLAILDALSEKYDVFFFVLKHKGKNPNEEIPENEIKGLEKYGKVEVFEKRGARPESIAREFRCFIEQRI